MIRNALLVAALGLTASTFLACSSGDVAVGKSQAQQLKTRSDGSPTGNGATCTLDGVVWGGTAGGSAGSGTGTVEPGQPGTVTPDPGTTGGSRPAPNPPTAIDTTSTATYPVAATFPAPDGCNTCKCESDGIWCTVQACGGGGTGGGGGGGGGKSCTVDGKTYPDGASFPSSDGCNTCSCVNGAAACTAMACAAPPPAVCTYNGKTYGAGESFPSTDGCNSCSCQASGGIVCTQRACAAP